MLAQLSFSSAAATTQLSSQVLKPSQYKPENRESSRNCGRAQLLGYVSHSVETNLPLSALTLKILEQGSRVLALEMVKNRMAYEKRREPNMDLLMIFSQVDIRMWRRCVVEVSS